MESVPCKRRAIPSHGLCDKWTRATASWTQAAKEVSSGKRKEKVKLASLNVGSMTGRSGEIVQLVRTNSLQVLCVQETKWKGSKAIEIGAGYKLYYLGDDGTKNGVLCEDMIDRVLAVERTCDREMRLKEMCRTSSAVMHHKWGVHTTKKTSSGSTWTRRCKRCQEVRGWLWRVT